MKVCHPPRKHKVVPRYKKTVLVERYEIECGIFPYQVYDILACKSQAPKTVRVASAIGNTKVEVG